MNHLWRLFYFAATGHLNLGSGWVIRVDGADLVVQRGGDVKVRITEDGALTPLNNWNDGDI